MWKGKTVSVVLPAYNEEDGIRASVEEFFATKVVDEVIVVNNNSKDRTVEEASKTPARIITETKQGYGAALTRGLREAKGDFVVLAEPDGTFLAADIVKLLAYADDADMVCGTRTTAELIWEQANMGWALRVGNIVVAKTLEVLFNTCSLSDCGCTFRLIHRDALARFVDQLTVTSSHFLPEMVILARAAGLRILEVPVNYRSRKGVSKITGSIKGTVVTGANMIGLIASKRLSRNPLRPAPRERFVSALSDTTALHENGTST